MSVNDRESKWLEALLFDDLADKIGRPKVTVSVVEEVGLTGTLMVEREEQGPIAAAAAKSTGRKTPKSPRRAELFIGWRDVRDAEDSPKNAILGFFVLNVRPFRGEDRMDVWKCDFQFVEIGRKSDEEFSYDQIRCDGPFFESDGVASAYEEQKMRAINGHVHDPSIASD